MCRCQLADTLVVLDTPQVQFSFTVNAGRTNDPTVGCLRKPPGQGVGITLTAECLSDSNRVARYVTIEPDTSDNITQNYMTLCEVIIRGHVYNRNMTVFHGKYNFIVSVSA